MFEPWHWEDMKPHLRDEAKALLGDLDVVPVMALHGFATLLHNGEPVAVGGLIGGEGIVIASSRVDKCRKKFHRTVLGLLREAPKPVYIRVNAQSERNIKWAQRLGATCDQSEPREFHGRKYWEYWLYE